MTSSIASNLQASPSAYIVRLIVGLVLGFCIAVSMFWGLQKMIMGGETIVVPLRASSNLSSSRFPDYAESLKIFESGALQQVSKPLPSLIDSASETGSAIDIQSPVIDPKEIFTGGFSLGVGEGDYLPIIKIINLQHRRVKTLSPYPSVDGYCTVQNPVPRVGAAKDSTIMKGNCPISSGG